MNHEPAPVTRELPQVQQAPHEVSLIGACILGGIEVFLEVASRVQSEVFELECYQQAFDLMAEMIEASKEIDVATVMTAWAGKFGKPCPPEVWLSPDYVASPHQWPAIVEETEEAWNRRKVVQMAAETLAAAREGANTAQDLRAILEGVEDVKTVGAFIEGGEVLKKRYREFLLEQIKKGGGLAGIATGFDALDRATDGFVPGTMSVVAARPSEGKTALGLSFLVNMCFQRGVPCLFVSIEMSREAILNRICSMVTGIPARTIRRAEFSEAENKKIKWFLEKVKEAPFWISYAPGATVDDIHRLVRTAVNRHQVGVVFVDYLQIIEYKGKLDRRHEQVQHNSRQLSAIAKKIGPHICALAQVSRKSAEENRQPRVNEISDSDQIEKDAEMVLLLHRPKSDKGTRGSEAVLGLGKVREGETGAVKLEFDGPRVQFREPQTKIKKEDIPSQVERHPPATS